MEFKKVFYIRNGSSKGYIEKVGNEYRIWKKLNDEEYGYHNIIAENSYNELYKIPKIFNLKYDLKRIMNIAKKSHNAQRYFLYLADNEYPLCMASYEKEEAKRLWDEDN